MRETPAEDFAAWHAAYDYEPWGEERADVRAAVGHAIADSARLKAKSKPFREYMPFYREPEAKAKAIAQSVTEKNALKQKWRALTQVWGKALERIKAAKGTKQQSKRRKRR